MNEVGPIVRLAGWLALGLFVVLFVLGAFWIAPGGPLLFDTRFWGYCPETARDILAVLGAPDKGPAQLYLNWHRPIDTVFPIVLTVWLIGMIRSRWQDAVGAALCLLPVAYLLFDLSENARVAEMLRTGPGVDANIVTTAALMTVLKFVCVVPSLILAIFAWRAQIGAKGQGQ